MERLIYTTQKVSDKKLHNIEEIFVGTVLAVGTFITFLSEFDLTWNIREFYRGSLAGGLATTWNMIAETLGNVDGVFISRITGEAGGNGLFLTLIFILLSVISLLTVKSQNGWLLIIYPLITIIPAAIFGLQPSAEAVSILTMGILLGTVRLRYTVRAEVVGAVFSIVFILIILASMKLPFISQFTQKPLAVRNIGEAVSETAENLYYGQNPLGGGNLLETKRETTDDAVLKITMSKPDSLYLRGFVGDYLAGNQWEPLPNTVYYNNLNLMYWLKKENLNVLGQIGQIGSLLNGEKDTGKNEIKVENIGANSKYAYIPYEIDKEGVEPGKVWGGSFVTGGKYIRLKTYTYKAEPNQVKNWTTTAGKLFTGDGNDIASEYLIGESYYNESVYEYYTYISDGYEALLKENFGNRGDQSKGHIGYKTAVDRIEGYLNDNFIYAEDIGAAGNEDKNAVERFFSEKKGYDVHYATAAALMFRYYGIPTRYVEGYLVTPEDVETMNRGGAIEITGKNAHSWVEIYVDGIGFVPVEVSPPYKGVMEEADMNVGISNESLQDNFDEIYDSNSSQSEQKDGGDEKSHPESMMWKKLLIIGGMLILILLSILSVKLTRKLVQIYKRRKLFRYGRAKDAVAAIYQYMREKNLPVDEETTRLGNRAAYSQYHISEKERELMIEKLRILRKAKNRNERD